MVSGLALYTDPDDLRRKGLTELQAKFVYEYLLNPNKGEAARRAGYSSKTANAKGHELFKTVKIRREIEEVQRAERLDRKFEFKDLVEIVVDIINLDLGIYYDKGRPRDLSEFTPRQRRPIKRVIHASNGKIIGYDFHSLEWAIQLARELLGLENEKTGVNVQVGNVKIWIPDNQRRVLPPASEPTVLEHRDYADASAEMAEA